MPHLLKGEFSDNAGTGIDGDRDQHFPVDVLRKAAGLGLGGVHVGEQHGGSALGRADGVLVFEAPASGCPAIAGCLSIHNMVAWMIGLYGDASQRERRLPRLCAMDDLASCCLTEPGAGAAQVYVVRARTGEPGPRGISAFLVDDPGISFGPNERKTGWHAQPTRQVVLDGVRIPADRLLGRAGEGFRIAMNGLNGGRLGIAACSLGGARSALDRSLAHLADREAFGARLLDAQALRFRLADIETELTAARALDARDPQAPYLCAMAKRFATDTGYSVADRALQLHGGYGYHAEYGIEKIVRDLRVHRILEGSNEIMRVIVARGLTEALG
ncbi:acyl-CoA dehydrogenase family protein [Streptomyces griseofuscus]|uniref:acyl-CoA dehydrogenase family protein n=1 Tax=Streptomyces griseofuscus TaxID=146922 RepID=UPI00340927C5